MRYLVLVPMLIVAACSEGGGSEDSKAKGEASKKLELAAGQWEITSEVTKLTSQDKSPPAINTPAGSKTTASVCVGEGEGRKPPAALLAGSADYQCDYGNHYMSSGMLNSQLDCKREGLNGKVMMSVDGSYTADTIEANQSLSTFLPGSGDVNIVSKVTGRRTGECTAAPEGKDAPKAG